MNRRRRLGYKNGYKVLTSVVAKSSGLCPLCAQPLPISEFKEYIELRRRRAKGESVRLKGKRRRLNANIDHIIPLAKGGSNHINNYQLVHMSCNSLKGDRLFLEVPAIPTTHEGEVKPA